MEIIKFACMKFASGKGIAFVVFAYLQVIGLFALAMYRPELNWSAFATALGAVNVPFFGSAAWKAVGEAKGNGKAA